MSTVSGTDGLRTPPARTARLHAILWPTLVVLAGVAAVVQPGMLRLIAPYRTASLPLSAQLVREGVYWLLGTLPVLLSGALAIVAGQRTGVRPAVGLAAGLVAGSTFVETIGIVAWSTLFGPPRMVDVALLYALSTTLLAGAWLALRGWRPLAFLTTPLAGIASWLTIPAAVVGLEEELARTFGEAFGSFLDLLVVYTLEILVIGIGSVAATVWRRARPDAPLRHP